MIHPERIARATASLFRVIALIGLPAVRGLSLSSDLVMKILGVRKSQEPPVTEEEIKLLIEQGTQAGVFVETEQALVKSIFRLADRAVSILMTPRRDIVWLDLDDGEEVNHHKIMESPFSRFPVGQGELGQCFRHHPGERCPGLLSVRTGSGLESGDENPAVCPRKTCPHCNSWKISRNPARISLWSWTNTGGFRDWFL